MTSTTDGTTGKNGVKTLAIRLEPELHAQLSLVAQLRGTSITDEIRKALDGHLAAVRSSPEFADRAESALADIDRQAAAKRDAVTTLFGDPAPPPGTTPARKQQRGGAGGTAKD